MLAGERETKILWFDWIISVNLKNIDLKSFSEMERFSDKIYSQLRYFDNNGVTISK